MLHLHKQFCNTGHATKPMKKAYVDGDETRAFYLCVECGNRTTYNVPINGQGDGWPKDVEAQAERDGLIKKKKENDYDVVEVSEDVYQDWQCRRIDVD